MFESSPILLWAFATCVSVVMMATLVHRRREQLIGQLRDYVARQLERSTSGEADPAAGDRKPPAGQ